MQAEKEPEGPQKAEFVEPRPTCVTVIGWAWIILGGLVCVSGIMAIFNPPMVSRMSGVQLLAQDRMPTVLKFFPLFAAALMGLGVLGLISGVKFLRLKAWSRVVLEVLTWLAVLYVVVFATVWLYAWLSMAHEYGVGVSELMRGLMGTVVIAICGVPVLIMLMSLRGEKVLNALRKDEDQAAGEKTFPWQ